MLFRSSLMVLGFIGGMYHLINHSLFKTTLFLGAGAVWFRTGTVLAAVQLDDGRLLVQAVMNNDMEADSVFRVRDDANTLSIEPLPYSLEE